MGAADLEASAAKAAMTARSASGLGGPTDLVGRLTQIAAGDEDDFSGDGCNGASI